MSTNLPTKWDEELAKHATKQAAVERPAVGKIGFKGGVMTYQNVPIPGNKLNVVIIAAAKENAYYPDAYDANNVKSPACFALALGDDPLAPHPQAQTKMAATCAECRYNAWGSDPKGGKGKACKENRRLVMVPQSAVLSGPNIPAAAGSVQKAESASASIPPTSLKNWANYTAQLAGEYRRPSWAMITEMSVIPNARSVFEVKFSPVGLVDDSHLGDLMARVETANSIVMTPYSQNAPSQPAQAQPNRKY